MYSNLLIFCILSSMSICETYKILLVIPFPFKSHSILGEAFVMILLKNGHEVSYITPDPVENSHPNLSQIVINSYNFVDVNLKTPKVKRFKDIFGELFNITYSIITDAKVNDLLENTSQTFDLVIAEWMLNDLYVGFSAVFNCPYIWFFTLHHDQEIMRLIHGPQNPTVTTNLRTGNVPPLNFLQRVQELWLFTYFKYWAYFYQDPIETKVYKEVFGPIFSKRGRLMPSYEKIRYSASFILSNTHITLRDSPVLPHNYKAIGGFHISDTPEPLNQELSNIMENSGNGVVLFSLGSFLKAEDMSASIKKDLLATFSKLNYTILWKINEQFEKLPSNVKIFRWIPIQSVLAHPKCVLFITHGGALSTMESIHFGVPIIGVPIFADQTVNIKFVMGKGVARMVSLSANLAADLKEAMEDMLRNPRYKENMKTLSGLYHDRLLPPSAEILHWVEHVVTTGGAPHLRSPALMMPWYKKYYIDLAVTLIVLLTCVKFLVTKLFVFIIDTLKIIYHTNGIVNKKKRL